MELGWSRVIAVEGWADVEGRDPYAGETVTLKVRLRHETKGAITSLNPDDGDALSFSVTKPDGSVWASGNLDNTDYTNNIWNTDIQLPPDPTVLTVRWTAVIDGATGKDRHSIRVVRA